LLCIAVKCSISQKDSKDKVKTFDGLEYELMDLPDCEVLLAKDCSRSQLFTILMSKRQRDGKALRILMPNSQIDVNVQRQEVKVDGKNVPLYAQEKKIEYITINNKQIPVELKKTDEGVEVKVKSLGIEVSIKRTKVEIKVGAGILLLNVTYYTFLNRREENLEEYLRMV
jgi:hypothetical protein